MPTRIVCILAGGRSSRFGSSKLDVHLDGSPLLAWLRDRLDGFPADGWCVSLAPEQEPPAGCDRYDFVVRDQRAFDGPLQAVAAALRQVAGADELIVCAADMPTIDAKLLMRLTDEAYAGAPLVMGRWKDGRVEPMPSLWRVVPAGPLLEQAREQGMTGPSAMAQLPGVACMPLAQRDRKRYLNLNRPEDLAPLEKTTGTKIIAQG